MEDVAGIAVGRHLEGTHPAEMCKWINVGLFKEMNIHINFSILWVGRDKKGENSTILYFLSRNILFLKILFSEDIFFLSSWDAQLGARDG